MSAAPSPEERKAERLARVFDLRSFIGTLFVLFGVLVTIAGVNASQEDIDKALGINLSLWMGIIMLVVGAVFIAWMLAAPPRAERGHRVRGGGHPLAVPRAPLTPGRQARLCAVTCPSERARSAASAAASRRGGR